MLGMMLDELRRRAPLIHNITNYVTAGDCANMLIACGASPIMADAEEEVAEITALCSGLNINMGTISQARIRSMFIAGKVSNELGHPVLLDPVGAGASRLRMDTAMKLLDEIRFTGIRGNVSEIRCLLQGGGKVSGVDASKDDSAREDYAEETARLAMSLSGMTGAVVAVTGAVDVIAYNGRWYAVHNGHPMMASVSGTGCQLSAMTTAFLAANPGSPLEAAAASVCAMGLAGEIARERLLEGEGNSSYRDHIIDAVFNMTGKTLDMGARYEVR